MSDITEAQLKAGLSANEVHVRALTEAEARAWNRRLMERKSERLMLSPLLPYAGKILANDVGDDTM